MQFDTTPTSNGQLNSNTCILFIHQAPVVQELDNVIHRISIRKTNCAILWIVIYPVDSDNPPFEQLGPGSSKVEMNFASANTS